MQKEKFNDLYEETVKADEALNRVIRELKNKYYISEADIQKLEDARQDADRENYLYFYLLGEGQPIFRTIINRIKKMFT